MSWRVECSRVLRWCGVGVHGLDGVPAATENGGKSYNKKNVIFFTICSKKNPGSRIIIELICYCLLNKSENLILS